MVIFNNLNNNNNRILFCSSFLPPENAGPGRNALSFARFLSDKGYKVTLISLNRKGKLKFREKNGNLSIIRILYYNRNIITKFISLIFIILPCYLYFVSKNKIIFIYGGNITAFELLIIFGKLFGGKIIFRSTMLYEDDIKTLINKYPKIIRVIRKIILQWISYYFSINSEFTKTYLELYNNEKKIFKSVHGVDTRIFKPVNEEEKLHLRKKLNIPTDLFIIISVGYLIKRKGFDELFIIMSKLKIPFLYVIIGDIKVSEWHYMCNFNDEMNSLYTKGKKLLKDKVLFTGPKENVSEYLQSSDVFIINSKQEGFPPNALQEAMACGIPPIIPFVDGSENTIVEHEKNSLIFKDVNEVNSLIEKCYFDRNYSKQIGIQANRSICDQASFERLYQKLFKQLT